MPKTTRTSANNKQNNKKTKEYFYIIFGEYDRAMSANSEEKGHNNLCIDLGHDRSFLSREAALCFLYHAVATMGDDKIIHGSMRITGIQCVTKEQVAIWHEDTGILRTAGLDTTSKGKITTKFWKIQGELFIHNNYISIFFGGSFVTGEPPPPPPPPLNKGIGGEGIGGTVRMGISFGGIEKASGVLPRTLSMVVETQ